MSLIIMILKFAFGIMAPFHFLLWVPVLLIISFVVNVVVSLAGKTPDAEVTDVYTWKKHLWHEDSEELKTIPWYKNFRYLSVFVVLLAILEYIIF